MKRFPVLRSGPGLHALLALVWWLILAGSASASAWPQKKGHGLLIWQAWAYTATERFDEAGDRASLGEQARFRSTTVQGWWEMGLSDAWTLVASVPVARLSYRDRWYEQRNASLGDVQAGLRRSLRRPERGWQVAVQGLIKAPAYGAAGRPRPGNGQADLEGSLLAGRSFPVGSRWGYIAAEAGFRKRWGRPAGQLRGEVAAGLHLNGRTTLSGQFFFIRGLGSLLPPERATNPLIEPRFDLYKVQASLLVRVAKGFAVQAGYLRDIAGRNVGAGHALVVGLWQTF